MKIKSMRLQDFAGFDKIEVEFNPNITFLIGPNTAGKSRIGLWGVQSIFQGIAEKSTGDLNPIYGKRFRFITPGADKAVNEMILHDERHNCDIRVTRTITADTSKLKFDAPKEYPEILNQLWLNNLFNYFLISPEQFALLDSKDQARALGIDTTGFDIQMANMKARYTEINSSYRAYGEIEPVPEAKEVDVSRLNEKIQGFRSMLKEIRSNYKERYDKEMREYREEVANERAAIDKENEDTKARIDFKNSLVSKVDDLENSQIPAPLLKPIREYIDNWFLSRPHLLKPYTEIKLEEPVYDNAIGQDIENEIAKLQDEIVTAVQKNTAAEKYKKYKADVARKEDLKRQLEKNKEYQEEIIKDKKQYLASLNLGVPDISINDDGELTYKDRLIKEPYLSSGELLKVIVGLISSKHPDFKYVFLQEFILLDHENQQKILDFLISQGFQVVIEWVGDQAISGANCIVLKDSEVIESTVNPRQ